MSQTLSGSMKTTAAFTLQPTSGVLNGINLPINLPLQAVFQNGTAADQATKIVAGTVALAISTPQSLTLTAMTDVFGAAVSFTAIRFIALKNLSTTDGQVVTVGNSGTHDWLSIVSAGGTVPLYPGTATNPDGGLRVIAAPGTTGMVVSSTNNIIQLDPGANAISVAYLIVGY
jgi:hypothetical protein